MSDDPVSALARLARERPPEPDPAWDALTRGELDPTAQTELRARPEAAALGPLFEPLGEPFADALAARVSAASGRTADPSETPDASPVAEVIPFVPRSRARWAVGVGLALAAAVGVALLVPGGESGALPAYTIEVSGGDQGMRGTPELGVPHVSVGSRLALLARPAVSVDGPVVAEAVIRPDVGGAAIPWPGTVEVSPGGAVRLAAVFDGTLPAGGAEVEVTLRRPEGTAPVTVLRARIVVDP